MTKSQMRVAVAQDVLDSLDQYKVRTKTGYVIVPARNGKKIVAQSDDSKAIAEELKPICTVCALGACFLSLVAIDNKFNFEAAFNDVSTYTHAEKDKKWLGEQLVYNRLSKVFSKDQLHLIERAFESDRARGLTLVEDCDEYYAPSSSKPNELAAIEFGNRYRAGNQNGTNRLRAIMQNIIDNKGKFVP